LWGHKTVPKDTFVSKVKSYVGKKKMKSEQTYGCFEKVAKGVEKPQKKILYQTKRLLLFMFS
jgi:hypothetical protein